MAGRIQAAAFEDRQINGGGCMLGVKKIVARVPVQDLDRAR
jgi:hypothetical protein